MLIGPTTAGADFGEATLPRWFTWREDGIDEQGRRFGRRMYSIGKRNQYS
jgi:hypothetical protein